MKNRKRFFLCGVLLLTVAIGCGDKARNAPATELAAPMPESEPESSMMLNYAADEAAALADFDAAGGSRGRAKMQLGQAVSGPAGSISFAVMGATQPDRHLIKNATVTIECDDPSVATENLTKSAVDQGGYVADLNEFIDGYGRKSVTLTVRVPADRFEAAMLNLAALGKVLNKQVSTQDVTEEYVDTESQSRNLKVTEERLIEHLERAGKLEEILQVEQELTRVRQQIERLEGRLRFLGHRVAFSTIHVTLNETPAAEPVLPAETFSVAKVFSEASRGLVQLGQRILVAAIWIGVWAPTWLLGLFAAWLVIRWGRKRLFA